MQKLVIDLEMCTGCMIQNIRSQEIIEIGAVLLSENNQIEKTYQSYIHNEYGTITPKIERLTGITPELTINAPTLAEVLKELGNVIEDPLYKNTEIYTWSDSDTTELLKELKIKGIDNFGLEQALRKYKDIQQIFGTKTNFSRQMNLAKALNLLGIDFEGKEHGALADAINTAKVLQLLENDSKVKCLVKQIHKTLEAEDLYVSMGSLFDFSKLRLGD